MGGDIAICAGVGCPLRAHCGRAMAYDLPFEYAYEVEEAVQVNGYCVNFMPVDDGQLTLFEK